MFLPHELIILILLRLHVKSLIRFKTVCKLWFSLISHDPQFANSHFHLNSETLTRRLLISTSNHETGSIDFEASLNDDSASISLNLPEYFNDFDIKGSCRGFILFCNSLNIYIWNPSIGIHKQILSPSGSNRDAGYCYGFGYDESTDDYLVVLISTVYSENSTFHLEEYFSLKFNTWKQVEGPHFPWRYALPHVPQGGCLYMGVIHWLAYRYDLDTEVIIAFDLMERKLSYMEPHGCSNPMQSDLWVYGEFLSAYTRNFSNSTIEIWVMNEYKGNSSWTMTLVLPMDLFQTRYFTRPLCSTKSSDIIWTNDISVLVKHDKNGQFLEQRSYSFHHRCKLAIYIDSLLSLPCDDDNQQA